MSKWKNQVLFQSTKADHDHGSESKVSQRYWFYYSFRIHGQERSVAIGRKEIGVTHPKDGTKVGSRANSEALILLMAPVMLFLLSAISPSFSWGHLFIVEVSCSSHHPFKKVGQELAYAYLGANVCFWGEGSFSQHIPTMGQGVKHGVFWEYTPFPTSPFVSLMPLQKSLHSWGLCHLLSHLTSTPVVLFHFPQ